MDIHLKDTQDDFIFTNGDEVPYLFYVGGVGTGKSLSLILRMDRLSREYPNNLGLCLRHSYRSLMDSTARDFTELTGIPVRGEKQEAIYPNGSKIIFRHCDGVQMGSVLKNVNAGWAAIDQAEEISRDVFDMVKMRIRRKDVKERGVFCVANAHHGWLWELLKKDGVPPKHKLLEATTPEFADILPKGFVENLKDTLTPAHYARYCMNDWSRGEGLVYSGFDLKRNVIEPYPVPRFNKHTFIIDHGWTNPTAIIYVFFGYNKDEVIIYGEDYEKEVHISEWSRRIKAKTDTRVGYCDPSMFSKNQQKSGQEFSHADEYREYGITLVPAIRSKDEASIARVNEFFMAGKIKIFNTCTNTIREIMNWRYRKPSNEIEKNLPEEPMDKDNHACDCIKYLIASRFGKTELPQRKTEEHTPKWYLEQKAHKPVGVHRDWR